MWRQAPLLLADAALNEVWGEDKHCWHSSRFRLEDVDFDTSFFPPPAPKRRTQNIEIPKLCRLHEGPDQVWLILLVRSLGLSLIDLNWMKDIWTGYWRNQGGYEQMAVQSQSIKVTLNFVISFWSSTAQMTRLKETLNSSLLQDNLEEGNTWMFFSIIYLLFQPIVNWWKVTEQKQIPLKWGDTFDSV